MYLISTRHKNDLMWTHYASRPDFSGAITEWEWAVLDVDLFPDRHPADLGPWQVRITGPTGAIRAMYSSDQAELNRRSLDGLHLQRCSKCGRELTREDVFCDGVICVDCGNTVRAMVCTGRCRDRCKDAAFWRNANLVWLITSPQEQHGGELLGPCPWRPCDSVACAEFGPVHASVGGGEKSAGSGCRRRWSQVMVDSIYEAESGG